MVFHKKNLIHLLIYIGLITLISSCSETSTQLPISTPIEFPSPTPLTLPSGNGGGIIAFASDRNSGRMDLYLINADGSELAQITHTKDDIISPSWSPDGSNLAFLVSRSGQLSLSILSLDSALANPLTDHSISLVEDPVEESPPSWSPDGSMIFYAAEEEGIVNLFKIDSDGMNKFQITDNEYNEKHPSLSPDGTKLVFSSDKSGSFDLYLIDGFNLSDIQLQIPIQLTSGEGDDLFPSWSPDSGQILFTTTQNGDKNISIIELESGSIQTIQDSTADEWMASWSPASNQIVFSCFNFDNALNDIYIYHFESKTLHAITNDNFDNWWPAWRP